MNKRFAWLASYPKSGNTWLRMMLASIFAMGEDVNINDQEAMAPIATFQELDEFFGIESSELTNQQVADLLPELHATLATEIEAPIILRKVHDRFWRTSGGVAAFGADYSRGAVYIMRDPRDIAVSYAHHRGVGFDRIIDLMGDEGFGLASSPVRRGLQLPQPLGSWSTHVLSWTRQQEVPCLVIRYEDMLQAPLDHLRRVTRHLGIPATEAQLEAAVAATRFDRLREQEDRNGFLERPAFSTAPFFRKGIAGDYKAALTSEQQARIIARHGGVMADFGYI